jgi:TolA-binding protein
MFSKSANEFEVFGEKKREDQTLFNPPLNRRGTVSAQLSSQAPTARSDGVDSVASQRVQLLAAQYASGNHAKELQARLEILNHRLLEKSPRVSVEQVEFLENINAQLDTLSAKRVARAERLGLQIDRSKDVQIALRGNTRG